jgi:hypothetical protein
MNEWKDTIAHAQGQLGWSANSMKQYGVRHIWPLALLRIADLRLDT